MFEPKLKECAVQCASCPFHEKNVKEWMAVVNKLRAKNGMQPGGKFDAFYARMQIHGAVREKGDFACHNTVYDEKMEKKHADEFLQCPGATAFHRRGGKP